ncbi:unnamed protein product [Closterium sp. NIES-54]
MTTIECDPPVLPRPHHHPRTPYPMWSEYDAPLCKKHRFQPGNCTCCSFLQLAQASHLLPRHRSFMRPTFRASVRLIRACFFLVLGFRSIFVIALHGVEPREGLIGIVIRRCSWRCFGFAFLACGRTLKVRP